MAGVGVLLLKPQTSATNYPRYLYHEPGLSRLAELSPAEIPLFDGLFGNLSSLPPLVVTRRQGEWFKVIYDRAGREGWLKPERDGAFYPYDHWLRQNTVRLLPALQKKYYLLYQQPNQLPVVTVTPRQQFKVLMLRDVWAQVLTDRGGLGWLRWKDDDGRLVIGIAPYAKEK